jgi:CheY-like chemotaxis protein
VGWLPPIYDFINKPISVGSIRKVVHNIELFAESKVSRIYYTSYNKEEYSILAIPENLSDDIIYYDNLETLTSNLNRDSLQVVFIDVKSLGTKALRFLSFINEYKLNRNVYTVFCLSQDFTESEIQMLNSEMQNLTLKSKNHPLDLLKDLKDRLKIDEEIINKKQNLIEENVDDELIRLSGIHIPQSKHTILIVDDDADTLFTIGEIVKEMQYDTIYAHNGSECLLMLNHIIPDLILLDIMMPQMDGFETIKRIRSDDRFVAMPVIALTAYAMLDNKNVVTKNGFNDIVTKPVNSSLLASKINYYLKPKVGVV